jgi:hypothetical protein
MAEVWLRPNRRAIAFALVLPLCVSLLGILLMMGVFDARQANWLRIVGGVCLLIGAGLTSLLVVEYWRPRIGYTDERVLFYLRGVRPIATPIEVVEAFFLGRGPTQLGRSHGELHSVNLVARLSERATEWHHHDVKPALGSWCDGYVTIRGTWTEPLTENLVRELNHRLAATKRRIKSLEGRPRKSSDHDEF